MIEEEKNSDCWAQVFSFPTIFIKFSNKLLVAQVHLLQCKLLCLEDSIQNKLKIIIKNNNKKRCIPQKSCIFKKKKKKKLFLIFNNVSHNTE